MPSRHRYSRSSCASANGTLDYNAKCKANLVDSADMACCISNARSQCSRHTLWLFPAVNPSSAHVSLNVKYSLGLAEGSEIVSYNVADILNLRRLVEPASDTPSLLCWSPCSLALHGKAELYVVLLYRTISSNYTERAAKNLFSGSKYPMPSGYAALIDINSLCCSL